MADSHENITNTWDFKFQSLGLWAMWIHPSMGLMAWSMIRKTGKHLWLSAWTTTYRTIQVLGEVVQYVQCVGKYVKYAYIEMERLQTTKYRIHRRQPGHSTWFTQQSPSPWPSHTRGQSCLVGGWYTSTPLKNGVRTGWDLMKFSRYGKSIQIPWFQTTNQIYSPIINHYQPLLTINHY